MKYFTCTVFQFIICIDACQCNNSFTIESEQQSITVVNVCVGISIPPCISDDSDIESKVNYSLRV